MNVWISDKIITIGRGKAIWSHVVSENWPLKNNGKSLKLGVESQEESGESSSTEFRSTTSSKAHFQEVLRIYVLQW